MFDNNSDTNPEVLLALGQDPHNAVLNVERNADLGLATSGLNPGLTANQNGWVTTQTNETVAIPGAFSTDPSFTQPTTTGSIGGTGLDPTGAGDGTVASPTGGYSNNKLNPLDDPDFDPQGFFTLQ